MSNNHEDEDCYWCGDTLGTTWTVRVIDGAMIPFHQGCYMTYLRSLRTPHVGSVD